MDKMEIYIRDIYLTEYKNTLHKQILSLPCAIKKCSLMSSEARDINSTHCVSCPVKQTSNCLREEKS